MWEYIVPAWISATGLVGVTIGLVVSQRRASHRHEELERRQLIAILIRLREEVGTWEIYPPGLDKLLDKLLDEECAKDKTLRCFCRQSPLKAKAKNEGDFIK